MPAEELPGGTTITTTSDKVREVRLRDFLGSLVGGKLHTLPNAVTRLLDKLAEAEPDLDEIADLVMADPMLAARMLKIVNSSLWGLRREIETVRETVVFLRLAEVQNLVYSASVTNTFERDAPLIQRVRFWEHSLGCALFAKRVAQAVEFPRRELAYLGGLLHDIGSPILALHAHQNYERVFDKVVNARLAITAAEDLAFGFNHTDLADWMAETWHLPEELPDVIRHHHAPRTATVDPALVAVVRLADLLCHECELDLCRAGREETLERMRTVRDVLDEPRGESRADDLEGLHDEMLAQEDAVRAAIAEVY